MQIPANGHFQASTTIELFGLDSYIKYSHTSTEATFIMRSKILTDQMNQYRSQFVQDSHTKNFLARMDN